jgi:LmbE family N-acetylglucosaminyl deacetylase
LRLSELSFNLYPVNILAIFAHPDDKAFGPAGTLSRYSVNGHSVRLITLTRGEAGTLGPARHLTRGELGLLRAEELRCSAESLRLSGLQVYDLPDGKLKEIPDEEGLDIIRRGIAAFAPDALITFHSAGISLHPDHQTAARWCLQAAQETDYPLRLFAYGISEAQARLVTHRKLAPIPDDEVTHVIEVTEYLEYKFAAIRCHQSQAEGWQRIQQIEGGILPFIQREHFAQVWPQRTPAGIADRLED